MRIALVSPPLSLEARYGILARAGSSSASLGLLSLAAVARKEGDEPHIFDGCTYDQVISGITAVRPGIVGLTATTLSIFDAHRVAAGVKSVLPDTTVVIGGPHVSAVPVETMRRFPKFDIAVIGEGEDTLRDILSAESYGYRGIPGLAVRDGEKVVLTGARDRIKDLDSLPLPAWDLLPGFPKRFRPSILRYRQLPAATVVTSRGCPNNCIFCDRTIFGRSCRFYSAGYIIEMIRELHEKYGVRELVVEDDTFVMKKSRVMEICDGIRNIGAGITWTCLGRVDMVDRELLTAMKAAGCWQIGYGIESGDQSILDFVSKNIDLEKAKEVLRMTREAGIKTKAFFIVGFPGETKETLRKTMDFALNEPLDDISAFKLTPLPGSRLHDIAHEYGAFDDDWGRMNLLNTVFVPHGLTARDLDKAVLKMMRGFYSKPRVVFSHMRRVAGALF